MRLLDLLWWFFDIDKSSSDLSRRDNYSTRQMGTDSEYENNVDFEEDHDSNDEFINYDD